MKFFERETCERFIEMGMKSADVNCSLGKCWIKEGDDFFLQDAEYTIQIGDEEKIVSLDVFTPLDFLGDTDQARKNCEILWGNLNHLTVKGLSEHGSPEEIVDHGKLWETIRHQMLDAKDQIAFVEGFLK